MKVFEATNSTKMAELVYPMLDKFGVREDSRNGEVIRFLEPIGMTYTQPWDRGNHTPGRDANPFFHIAESMWMLAGRRDVKFLEMFNANMGLYSDDGDVFNAAYGYRLRHHFGFDQLKVVATQLGNLPNTRQAVCQLWDPADLNKTTLDRACNMSLVFAVVHNVLQMTVFNRSNDAVFGGVTGANPVHMSFIQQWMADKLGLDMGNLIFVSNNLHVYTELYDHWNRIRVPKYAADVPSRYMELADLEEIEDLCTLIERKEYIDHDFVSDQINYIVKPIINAWIMRKFEGKFIAEVKVELSKCVDQSLFKQCHDWLEKRK